MIMTQYNDDEDILVETRHVYYYTVEFGGWGSTHHDELPPYEWDAHEKYLKLLEDTFAIEIHCRSDNVWEDAEEVTFMGPLNNIRLFKEYWTDKATDKWQRFQRHFVDPIFAERDELDKQLDWVWDWEQEKLREEWT